MNHQSSRWMRIFALLLSIVIGTSAFAVGKVNSTGEEPNFEDFIERLYVVALNRESEPEGKAFWIQKVTKEGFSGADCARGFLIEAKEFQNRNLPDEEFLDVLYKTFFDREADADGKAFWLNYLKEHSREDIINGFIESTEWCNLCAKYNIRSGAKSARSEFPSKNAEGFAERLYSKCLGRESDKDGLLFWAMRLTNLDSTGAEAARDFFMSTEFLNLNTSNDDFLTRMYRTFFDREPDADGMAFWTEYLKTETRYQVICGFSESQEFTNLCLSYGILRGTLDREDDPYKPKPTPTPVPTATPTPVPKPTNTPQPGAPYDLSGMVIVLDPGHQKKANNETEPLAPWSNEQKAKVSAGTSGVYTKRPEYEVNLEIGLMMRDYLESCGATVIMTRTTNDVNISNIERAMIAVNANADVFLRLHCDGSSDSSARGIGVFVCSRGELADKQVGWGNMLGRALASATGSKYRGCNASTTYSGLNWATSVPSFLLEMGFMSNADDDKLLSDPVYQKKLCSGVGDFCAQMKKERKG